MQLHDAIDVLIGGYLSKDAAEEHCNAVLECGGHLQGAVIVIRDLEGNLSVEQTDHMAREGVEGLGAMGPAVRLLAPPAVLATTAIGAGAGELLGHVVKEKLGNQAGAMIPIGDAGLIVAYSHTGADKLGPAVTRTIKEGHRRSRRPTRPSAQRRDRRRPSEDERAASLSNPVTRVLAAR